jgi:predicted porin
MNKWLASPVLLMIGAHAALAQTSVNIYGIADAGLVHESSGVAGSLTKLTSGVGSASRLGFRGAEDLGGGTSAIFTLETGYRIDTGEVDTAGTIFNRQAFVGLKTNAGTLTLGRQYTPWHQALVQVADPFGTGFAGGAKNLFPDWSTNVRTSNTIVYAAPSIAGVSADIAYSVGEQAGSNAAGRQFGASLGYSRGPLNVRLAYNNKNSDVAPAPGVAAVSRTIGTNSLLAANYDFGVARAYVAYGMDKGFNSGPMGNNNNPYGGVKPTPSTDSNEVMVGVAAPLGHGRLLASYTRKNDKTSLNQDAHAWGIGYLYALSKRTDLYAVYGAIVNSNGAGYTVANNSEAGTGNRASNLGIRHTF